MSLCAVRDIKPGQCVSCAGESITRSSQATPACYTLELASDYREVVGGLEFVLKSCWAVRRAFVRFPLARRGRCILGALA